MTNFEKIKAMSVEEMAMFLNDTTSVCLCCEYLTSCCVDGTYDCYEGTRKWLESEVEEDG